MLMTLVKKGVDVWYFLSLISVALSTFVRELQYTYRWVANQPLGTWMTLIKCKIRYMNGSIFQNFPNMNQNWFKFWKNRVILLTSGPKLSRLVYKWVTFSWKIGICMVLLSNSVAAHPYQNQTWVPPWIIGAHRWQLTHEKERKKQNKTKQNKTKQKKKNSMGCKWWCLNYPNSR